MEETDEENKGNKCVGSWLSSILYDKFFHPLLLKDSAHRILTNGVIWGIAAVLFGLAVWGLTEREVGLGLEDFCKFVAKMVTLFFPQ